MFSPISRSYFVFPLLLSTYCTEVAKVYTCLDLKYLGVHYLQLGVIRINTILLMGGGLGEIQKLTFAVMSSLGRKTFEGLT